MSATLFEAIMAVGLLLLAWGFAQFLVHLRYGRAELAAALAQPSHPVHDYTLAFIVPCLDEQAVIGELAMASKDGRYSWRQAAGVAQ